MTVVRERDLQQQVLDLARSLGWRCYHTFDSRRSEAGFPDVIAVRDDRMLAIECKSAKGRVTKPQREWLVALDAVRHSTSIVLRPAPTLDELAELLAR